MLRSSNREIRPLIRIAVPCRATSFASAALAAALPLAVALAVLSAAPGQARAGDVDGDGVADASDNCVWTQNDDQRDTDLDGLGDACECGDMSADGVVDELDANLIQSCAVGLIDCDGLCDVTGDRLCNSIDARLVQRVSSGQIPKANLICEVMRVLDSNGRDLSDPNLLPGAGTQALFRFLS